MLRKSPATNVWAAIFNIANFSKSSLKIMKLSEFLHFFFVFTINSSSRVNIYTRKWRLLLMLNLTK